MNKKQKIMLIRILTAAALLAVLHVLPVTGWMRFGLYLIPYLIAGYDILRKALKGIQNRQVFDENFLMAVATVGAIALALYERSGDYTEAIAVMLFYQIGEWFQSYAVGRSRRNISELMDIRPDYANVEQDGKLEQVDPDEVSIGTVIVVQPGEKVPIDGTVVEGASTLNTAALTGESLPREVREGDEIISGCVNMTGLLKIRTTREFGESTVSKILDLVENASEKKSTSEHFITRFARYYTPCVVIAAVLLFALPSLALALLDGSALPGFLTGTTWQDWLHRALIFLVISCPCALVISVPLSFFGGIGGASRCGILVKGGNYLEALARTETVVFDKTGTLTQGTFTVAAIHPQEPYTEDQLLEFAALAEHWSDHPISLSLKAACKTPLDAGRVTDVEEIAGHGVCATVDGRKVCVGNSRLMERQSVNFLPCELPGTIVHVTIDGFYAGHIVISDLPKADARQAVEALKRSGVKKTVMLTGDTEAVARAVAGELGIDEYHAELLPADKVAWTEKLLAAKSEKGKLAFVGDGINDAPVLTRADIGIAMGALGSDAAIEAADIVLMDDKPSKIATAIRISRKTLRIVHQNIWFALLVKFAVLILGAFGRASMWAAVFADVGVAFLAILNATRALHVDHDEADPKK